MDCRVGGADCSSAIGADPVVRPLRARISAALGAGVSAATLLCGPAGCGKTLLARSLADAASAAALPWPVRWLEVGLKPHAGAAAMALHTQLAAARAAAPCVLVIDELHALAPADAAPGSPEAELALQLARGLSALRGDELDGGAPGAVFVLGLCREPEAVHPSVRRSGRMSHELAVPAPSPAQRVAILEAHAARLLPPADEAAGGGESACGLRRAVRGVALDAHGLCGAQLAGLCQHAAMAAWRRAGASGGASGGAAGGSVGGAGGAAAGAALPTEDDWWVALHAARAATLGALQLPSVPPAPASEGGGGGGGGAAAALRALSVLPSGGALLASVIAPLRSPSTFVRMGVAPPRGVLMHGAAGCGKTSLARHVAAAAAANFIEVCVRITRRPGGLAERQPEVRVQQSRLLTPPSLCGRCTQRR